MFRFCAAADGGRCALVAACAGLTLLAAPGLAVADDEHEVPIGTFELGSTNPTAPPSVDPTATPTDPLNLYAVSPLFDSAAKGVAVRPPDEASEQLFSDGVAALKNGDSERAERLFERLIARAPDAPLADSARRYLADIYRRPAGPAMSAREAAEAESAGRALGADLDRRQQSQPGAGAAIFRDLGSGRSGTAQRAPAALEAQFVAEAGDRIFFSAGSAELGSRARAVLAAQARFIERRPELRASIEGHADDAPMSVAELKKLSEARALAVRERLIAEGIGPDRLAVVARGREDPVSACADPDCAAQNRRAVTVLYLAPAGLPGPTSRRTDGETVPVSSPATH